MRFTKVNGLGNDFCVFESADALACTRAQWSALAIEVCDRTTGVGADGILIIGPGAANRDHVTAASMRIINADGSASEMCGNGLRAVGRLLVEQRRARAGGSQGFHIDTDAGPRTVWIDPATPELVRTTLGIARFGPEAVAADPAKFRHADGDPDMFRIGAEAARLVAVGNPHAIVVLTEPLTDAELARRGAAIECDDAFPDRINAQFARIADRGSVGVQTWERGAGATRACGTGAAAVVAGLHRAGLVDRRVVVTLPGGELTIEIDPGGMIQQTGPAQIERSGQWPAR
jgi:diaminopimelate epimerase